MIFKNMKLYIKLDGSGGVINHPMQFESAQVSVSFLLNKEAGSVTEEEILANYFAVFENPAIDVAEEVISDNGYKQLPNGNWTRNLVLKSLTQKEKIDKWVRGVRDHRLYVSDWSQLSDNELTDKERAKWTEYRHYLRKMPEIYADVTHPEEIVWPEPPLRKPLPKV
jgi:hypothetical protein